MSDLNSNPIFSSRPDRWAVLAAGTLVSLGFCVPAEAVVVVEPGVTKSAPVTLERPSALGRSVDFTSEKGVDESGPLKLGGVAVAFGMGLVGNVLGEDGTLYRRSSMFLGAGAQERTGRNLASIAAGPYEPSAANITELVTFGSNTRSNVLNVPAPGVLPAANTPKDSIPEPGTIGFGIAIAALILGNAGKAFVRCWKMTSASTGRDQG